MAAATPNVGVAPQYDTAHVYVAPEDFDRFVASLVATFGGTTTKQGVFTVTPTPSSTMSQLVLTPVGTVSVFGFKTPIPYPFGAERTGYLVTDMDAAIRAARATGADVLVTPFNDPIGRDAIIQWPGGVNTQLYWHTTAPSYPPLKTIPENRVYVSADRVAGVHPQLPGVLSRQSHCRRRACSRRRDRAASRYLSPHPDRFAVRQDGRARDGRPSSISLWPGDDRIRGGEPYRYARQSNVRRSDHSGASIYSRSAKRGHGAIPWRLHCRDPRSAEVGAGNMETACESPLCCCHTFS